jgi:hypothetical protein
MTRWRDSTKTTRMVKTSALLLWHSWYTTQKVGGVVCDARDDVAQNAVCCCCVPKGPIFKSLRVPVHYKLISSCGHLASLDKQSVDTRNRLMLRKFADVGLSDRRSMLDGQHLLGLLNNEDADASRTSCDTNFSQICSLGRTVSKRPKDGQCCKDELARVATGQPILGSVGPDVFETLTHLGLYWTGQTNLATTSQVMDAHLASRL